MVVAWLDSLITELGLEWTRYDYNIDPWPYFEKADASGDIQYAYMKGLYHVLDTLMRKHPAWFVETCATGSQRLDIGTIRRAISSWLSDQSVFPHICRYMQLGANRFIPAHLANSAVVTYRGPVCAEKGQVSFDRGRARWGVYSDPAMALRRNSRPGGPVRVRCCLAWPVRSPSAAISPRGLRN